MSELKVLLKDQDDGRTYRAVITAGPGGIGIHIEGFGDYGTATGFGEPVYIDVMGGVPRVHVWADINEEDPTHVILLDGAAESARWRE